MAKRRTNTSWAVVLPKRVPLTVVKVGEFDNNYNNNNKNKNKNKNIWNGRVVVKLDAHSVALSHQRTYGNDDFNYLHHSDPIFLENSIQYSDSNSP